ncbi:MAG: 3D-(3,5/4)-trihydroxycyclohexane-1,2-dione acylhydrolase (decyclizing) [Christensenellaceae bacterium]|jgi:3D-(3,5/4)-trihydroxycyclohexane-1,2-dione acylhydrolase (decyclizing)|nr:3D-(3,5/4)-trihydroxycyclohexane-1,2-dione acylhydrolase (decyclizing) [Christensenellaceae bacterium]
MTVGEAIVKFLDNQYVSFDGVESKFIPGVFTLFGHGCVLGVGEALAMTDHSLKVYQGKNEQGMAHVAASFAKQNNRRKILPCISSIGPGSANMVTAAAMATINCIPLLLLLGDTYATRNPDPVLQQLERDYDPNITTNDSFRPVVKYFDRISRPEMLESALLNAFRVLTDPASTGSVALALPQDVQGETYQFPQSLFKKRVHRIPRTVCSDEDLSEALMLIMASKHPLLIVGGGARYSEAGNVLAKLSLQCKIPLAETQAGKSTLPSSHPYNLGGIGVTGNSAANQIALNADLIIGVGTRFSDFTTSSKTLFSNANVISINTSVFHGSKLDAIRLIGDAKSVLELITSRLTKYTSSFTEEIASARKEWDTEYLRLSSIDYSKNLITEVEYQTQTTVSDFQIASGSKLTQTKALAITKELIPKDAIVVGAAGSLPGCMQRMWTTDSLYAYNMEYGYSCMGYEIAGALGSKIACPEKEVYSFVGDGSYLMLHSELVTAIQEGLKIVVLVFDNGGFGCINNLQMGKGIKSLATEFRYNATASSPFIPIDFAMNAKSYGCEAYTVRTPDELRNALELSKASTKPVLIDIKVLPKTMTGDYPGSFWQVGLSHLPRNEQQEKVLKAQILMLEKNK